MRDEAAIEAVALSKTYPGAPAAALDGVSLSVPSGRLFGLLGPNGAGKTTFLSIACGLTRPSSGQLQVLGRDASCDGPALKRLLGLVPQGLAVYPTLTARENLQVFGGLHGLAGPVLRERIRRCLQIAGLEEFADRRVETYSGGLGRRLNLVVALLHQPRLLVLDEPTVGIDPQSRHFIHATLRTMNREGMTVVYTSHYLEEVEQLCDEIAIIDHGRIVAHGTTAALLAAHQTQEIELWLGTAPSTTLRTAMGQLPGVTGVRCEAARVWLKSGQPAQVLGPLASLLQTHRVELLSLSLGATDLEQVFLAITGTRLRE